ncbi:kinase-like protein [Viridothelium virens]|uniref:Kinase-like protein n=1 Tax=Viridothelium virens TaxID=1048519 RepID=A0A6A6H0K3_VIRVR|nr:kinase-like protein [Viridothelium virens]
MDYDYTHPERHITGLVLDRSRNRSIRSKDGGDFPTLRNPDPPETLCWACGWTTSDQIYSGYNPRIKILYTRGNVGLWKIGREWILRDQPNDSTLGNDYITQEYLRNAPNVKVPVLECMMILGDPQAQVRLTLMTQAQGQTLSSVWHTLSAEQKAAYGKELAGYIRQWRTLQSAVMENVNHDQLYDILVGRCGGTLRPPKCKKIGYTVDGWLDNLEPELRKGLANKFKLQDPDEIERQLQELKANFPRDFPNVLTHGDIHMGNIIVRDNKIEAILDWELAGFYPAWVEYWMMCNNPVDLDHGLFDLLYEDGCLGITRREFLEKVDHGFKAVIDVWESCKTYHPDEEKVWYKPAWCKCKNYGGAFKMRDIGKMPEHQILDSHNSGSRTDGGAYGEGSQGYINPKDLKGKPKGKRTMSM